jgi:hypothetical protein
MLFHKNDDQGILQVFFQGDLINLFIDLVFHQPRPETSGYTLSDIICTLGPVWGSTSKPAVWCWNSQDRSLFIGIHVQVGLTYYPFQEYISILSLFPGPKSPRRTPPQGANGWVAQ